ncbi:putative nuclear distribution protein [Wickerhamomyces ciferrii]|uniref:Nuclear distribution protein n=1 Tax=Wickerhamomyces ciferrii (strain ATCC 14091 / BCRC 22168 / CBS 111 / JCM 3599 / NBRC 0793 / NRRL Y-1031 F-60-10) TaxID=1206466 RepID=K0KNJ5_WICCF|nr:putative nuclear distribution protein [Wickerhamomyces ciferrii]CCH42693.1 putative nuclear distribution protein [Wickerhamomyces ciferrii]
MTSTPETNRVRRLDLISESPLSNTSSPDRSFCQVKYKDYESAIDAIQQLEAELNEFQTSSYELEKELEKELTALELDNEELKIKNEEIQDQLNEIQREKIDKEKEFNKIRTELQNKIVKLEKDLEIKNSKIVDIEILNDNIEQNERNLNLSYKELEENYNSSVEKIILLEQEINDSKNQLMMEKLNHQNTKIELNEFKTKFEALERRSTTKSRSLSNPINPSSSTSSTTSSIPLSNSKMTKSNSIRQLHSMIEQSKGMESRIGNIKTSLNTKSLKLHREPKSSTTTKLTNATITTSTPSSSQVKPKRKIPLSPSSFKLSSFAGSSFNKMEKIEGSPAKPAKDFNKIFGNELKQEK